MRTLVLFALLALLSRSSPAQRMVRDRVYSSFGIYGFWDATGLDDGNLLTYTAKRPAQSIGFYRRSIILDRNLDTITTPIRYYSIYGSFQRNAPGGGYIITAGTPGTVPGDVQKVSLMRHRRDYSLAWARRYNFYNNSQEISTGILSTPSHYFFTVYSETNARTRFSLAKTDTSGNLLWAKAYGWRYGDFVADMKFTRQGHLLLMGHTANAAGTWDIKLLLLNQQGDSLASLRYAPLGPGRSVETPLAANNLFPLTDGGFLVLTGIDSVNRPGIPLAVKVDAQLRPVWTRVERYVPPRTSGAAARYGNAVELADGSVLVLCYYVGTPATEDRPFYLLRLDGATGQLLQRHEFRSTVCNRMQPDFIVADGDSAAYVLGACSAGPGGASVQAPYAARLSLRGLPAVVTAASTPQLAGAEAAGLGPPYPNPATSTVRVPYRRVAGSGPAAVTLLDALGRRVRVVPASNAPSGQVDLDLTGLPAGVYWLRFAQGAAAIGPARRVVVQP